MLIRNLCLATSILWTAAIEKNKNRQIMRDTSARFCRSRADRRSLYERGFCVQAREVDVGLGGCWTKQEWSIVRNRLLRFSQERAFYWSVQFRSVRLCLIYFVLRNHLNSMYLFFFIFCEAWVSYKFYKILECRSIMSWKSILFKMEKVYVVLLNFIFLWFNNYWI